MLPRYRYSKDGENIDNITGRALKQFRPASGKHLPSPLAGEGGSTRSGETDEGAAAQKIPHPSAALTPSPTRGEGRAGGTRMLPRHRYTKNGENIDNITDRALKQFPPAYGKHLPSPLAGEGGSTRSGETDEGWPRKRSLIRQLR